MGNRESRKERERRWAKEHSEWQQSGLAGGTLVEIGSIARGVRGQFAHDVRITNHDASDWLFRDAVDDKPANVRLFMLIPGDPSSSGLAVSSGRSSSGE